MRLSVFFVATLWVASAHAQERPAFFDTPSELVPVGAMTPGETYPLLVVLPPTNGTSRRVFEDLRGQVPLDAYYVLLTPGQPQRSDYLPRFSRYVEWAQERINADVDAALASHAVDPEQIFLLGFSLGGDTSWALLLRNPERYRGALVMGSRSSARPRRRASETLRRRRARVFFTMGRSDDEVRQRGIARAHERATEASLEARLVEFSGGHQLPPADVLSGGLRFLLRP
ncbi:MAG: hypothetical protein AAGE52_05015 [Myxococcota bacterium]